MQVQFRKTWFSFGSSSLQRPVPDPDFEKYLFYDIVESTKSGRYSMRKRNSFCNYTKMMEEYHCNRKFCKYCLKQSYEGGFDKNGLCPFCQGVCFCTRCSRQEMITKIKSIFLLLGGQTDRYGL